jgi:hypothetical protein
MITAELPARFAKLESDIAAERGDFTLFALFQREAVPDRWDLIISVPWASADQKAALDYIVGRIKSDLSPADLIQLSRIIFIDPTNLSVRELIRTVHVEHGSMEVRDRNFFGQPIRQAFFITSKEPGNAAA